MAIIETIKNDSGYGYSEDKKKIGLEDVFTYSTEGISDYLVYVPFDSNFESFQSSHKIMQYYDIDRSGLLGNNNTNTLPISSTRKVSVHNADLLSKAKQATIHRFDDRLVINKASERTFLEAHPGQDYVQKLMQDMIDKNRMIMQETVYLGISIPDVMQSKGLFNQTIITSEIGQEWVKGGSESLDDFYKRIVDSLLTNIKLFKTRNGIWPNMLVLPAKYDMLFTTTFPNTQSFTLMNSLMSRIANLMGTTQIPLISFNDRLDSIAQGNKARALIYYRDEGTAKIMYKPLVEINFFPENKDYEEIHDFVYYNSGLILRNKDRVIYLDGL